MIRDRSTRLTSVNKKINRAQKGDGNGRLYCLPADEEERAQRIHRETRIFDGLATSYLDKEYVKLLKETGVNTVHYTVAFTSFDRIDGLFNVTRGLVKLGYTDEDIAKIYSLNMRRALGEIWK